MSRRSIYGLMILAVFGHWIDMLLTEYLVLVYGAHELNPLTLWWWSLLGGPVGLLNLVKDFVTLPIFVGVLGYYCLKGKNAEIVNGLRIVLFCIAVGMVLPLFWFLYVFAAAGLIR
jgi:hypothetical protein